ncbi:MAG: ABC transporter substrate-binding protein [Gammaproteobacteria bacterium]
MFGSRPGGRRLSRSLWVSALVIVAFSCAPVFGASRSAKATVESLHAALIDAAALEADTENVWRKRVALLAPEINRGHDLDFMLEAILGPTWAEMGRAERNRLIDVHARYMVGEYATRAGAFEGAKFQYQRGRKDGLDLTHLNSTWVSGDGERHRLSYILRRSDRGWRVVNVLADGVSELALLHRRYHAVLSEGGVDGLINSLENELETRRRH